MKRKYMKCSNCKDETIHSIQKRTGTTNHKLKREVDRCDSCGYTIIKNRSKTWTKGGDNEKSKEKI